MSWVDWLRLAVLGFMFLNAIFILFFGGAGTLVNANRAIHAAEEQGYTDIEVVDKDIWLVQLQGCAPRDVAAFTMTATKADGHKHDLVICADTFLNETIISP